MKRALREVISKALAGASMLTKATTPTIDTNACRPSHSGLTCRMPSNPFYIHRSQAVRSNCVLRPQDFPIPWRTYSAEILSVRASGRHLRRRVMVPMAPRESPLDVGIAIGRRDRVVDRAVEAISTR